nr:GNAT family N-acetyltransferase [Aliiroseovarius subalbicans]
MAELLNQIIAIGGTTAFLNPLTSAEIQDWMTSAGPAGVGFVARKGDGQMVGFQWVDPHPTLGEGVAQIASFVRPGAMGIGIGSQLFDATRDATRALGYAWIDATIRADNESGLTYYQSRGFEAYRTDPDARLSDGRRVGKISKRYDLV